MTTMVLFYLYIAFEASIELSRVLNQSAFQRSFRPRAGACAMRASASEGVILAELDLLVPLLGLQKPLLVLRLLLLLPVVLLRLLLLRLQRRCHGLVLVLALALALLPLSLPRRARLGVKAQPKEPLGLRATLGDERSKGRHRHGVRQSCGGVRRCGAWAALERARSSLAQRSRR